YGGPHARVSSPAPGRSTLITSAPRSASIWVHQGPVSTRLRSNTRMPDILSLQEPIYIAYFNMAMALRQILQASVWRERNRATLGMEDAQEPSGLSPCSKMLREMSVRQDVGRGLPYFGIYRRKDSIIASAMA